MIKNKEKVIVAMSGGVDSSVSAWFLQCKNYQVEGLFMKNWEEDDNAQYCRSSQDLSDAEDVCKKLNIRLHKINFSIEYWNKVFQHFLDEHKKGNTPNPDVLCNKEIKFKLFLNYAFKNLQANYIATGHYARIKKYNGTNVLLRGIDCNKDQSYFLYTLKSMQLTKILFPIGDFRKEQIRMFAKKIGLKVANKKDSTGICFVGPRNIKSFLSTYIPKKIGNIITVNRKIIGQHDGAYYYTLGQRKGLKIGGLRGKKNLPWYVVDKNIENNLLIVEQGLHNKYLMSIGLIATCVNWINPHDISFPLSCTVKTRYAQKDISCNVEYINDFCVKVLFHFPVIAITPGQSVVFYIKEICVGGGIIKLRLPL
jgi:tRNA-specific 2-thiouridylase